MKPAKSIHPANPDWARDAFSRGDVIVAALVHDGVAELELCNGIKAFQAAGCDVATVGIHGGLIQAYHHNTPGHHYLVAQTIDEAMPVAYDALFVPGGSRSLHALQEDSKVGAFIRAFAAQKKPIAIATEAATLIADAAPDAPLVAAEDEAHNAAVQAIRLLIDRAAASAQGV